MRSRFVCVTDNRCDSLFNKEATLTLKDLGPNVRYLVFQKEEGEGTHHIHYQGYVELFRGQRVTKWSYMKTLMGSRTIHCEKRKGTQDEVIEYCTKELTRVAGPWKLGLPTPGQGYRLDVYAAQEKFKASSNKRERDLWDEDPHVMNKYPRMYLKYKGWNEPKRMANVFVTVAIGAPGTGKTFYGRYVDYQDDVFVVPIARTAMWYSGYDHHRHVVFDDFDGRLSKMGLKEFLKLTHNHTEKVEVKGGHVWWHPETIFITTNIPLYDWYDWGSRSITVMKRRIHRILDFGEIENIVCKNPVDVTKSYDWTYSEIE